MRRWLHKLPASATPLSIRKPVQAALVAFPASPRLPTAPSVQVHLIPTGRLRGRLHFPIAIIPLRGRRSPIEIKISIISLKTNNKHNTNCNNLFISDMKFLR